MARVRKEEWEIPVYWYPDEIVPYRTGWRVKVKRSFKMIRQKSTDRDGAIIERNFAPWYVVKTTRDLTSSNRFVNTIIAWAMQTINRRSNASS